MTRFLQNALYTVVFMALFLTHAQGQQTEFLDAQMHPVAARQDARLVRTTVLQADSSVIVEVAYVSGGLKMKGQYSCPSLLKEEGFFTYYHANGLRESEGYYSKGEKIGIWKRWDWEGKGKPDRVYPQSVSVAQPGCSTAASFPGGIEALNEYVLAEMRFPVEASKLGVEGWVYTAFTINSAGEVRDIEVIQTSHHTLNHEAKRIVKCMPDWKPAMKNGAAIDSKFILPIVFDQLEDPKTMVRVVNTGTN